MNIKDINKYFDDNKENFYKINSKRKLVISDIHGCYNEFIKLLEKVEYDHNKDQLILLGDYVDRGWNSKKVVEKVMKLHKDGAIVLKGNHDKMFVDAIKHNSEEYDALWLSNGGMMTIADYMSHSFFDDGFDDRDYDLAKFLISTNNKEHIEFLESLPLYFQDHEIIYVHAGISPYTNNMKNQIEEDLLWIREPFLYTKLDIDKTVIFGHTPTPTLNEDGTSNIWISKDKDKIGIDGGCCFGSNYRLNCLIIENGNYKTEYVRRGES